MKPFWIHEHQSIRIAGNEDEERGSDIVAATSCVARRIRSYVSDEAGPAKRTGINHRREHEFSPPRGQKDIKTSRLGGLYFLLHEPFSPAHTSLRSRALVQPKLRTLRWNYSEIAAVRLSRTDGSNVSLWASMIFE